MLCYHFPFVNSAHLPCVKRHPILFIERYLKDFIMSLNLRSQRPEQLCKYEGRVSYDSSTGSKRQSFRQNLELAKVNQKWVGTKLFLMNKL